VTGTLRNSAQASISFRRFSKKSPLRTSGFECLATIFRIPRFDGVQAARKDPTLRQRLFPGLGITYGMNRPQVHVPQLLCERRPIPEDPGLAPSCGHLKVQSPSVAIETGAFRVAKVLAESLLSCLPITPTHTPTHTLKADFNEPSRTSLE